MYICIYILIKGVSAKRVWPYVTATTARQTRRTRSPPWKCCFFLLYLYDCLQCAGWDRIGFWNTGRSCWIYIRLTGIRPFIQQLNESHKGPGGVNSAVISWSLPPPDCASPLPRLSSGAPHSCGGGGGGRCDGGDDWRCPTPGRLRSVRRSPTVV